MTLARIIGLVLAPTGVIVGAWAVEEMVVGEHDAGAWVAVGLGLAIGLAMIIVGARYILKPSGKANGAR